MTGPPLRRHDEEVMGTVVSFSWRAGRGGEPAADEAVRAACTRLHDIDARFSTWVADSPMSRVRRGEMGDDEDPEIAAVLGRCLELRERSGGWFDPWAATGGVDPTGMVKGWAAEEAVAILAAGGVAAALVNAGGDVASLGTPERGGDEAGGDEAGGDEAGGDGPGGEPWRVGIRHPWRPEALAGVVALGPGGAVASSGSYERGPHLWRPGGGVPSSVAASVTGPSLEAADAFATALAVAGEDFLRILRGIDGFEGWFVTAEGTEQATEGFPWVDAGTARLA
ncbi:MAG: FAD:protein FMN transferase [Acidimicrobiales bacterium]